MIGRMHVYITYKLVWTIILYEYVMWKRLKPNVSASSPTYCLYTHLIQASHLLAENKRLSTTSVFPFLIAAIFFRLFLLKLHYNIGKYDHVTVKSIYNT